MKIGDKVVFRKLADKERIGRIVGFSEDGGKVAIKTKSRIFIVMPPSEAIVVIKEAE